MSGRLEDFLVNLASDPDRMARFLADPDAAMEAAGLTPEEREAVRSRHAGAVYSAMGSAPGDDLTEVFAVRPKPILPGKPGARKPAKKKAPKKPARKAPRRKAGRKGGAKKGTRTGGPRKGSRKSAARKSTGKSAGRKGSKGGRRR